MTYKRLKLTKSSQPVDKSKNLFIIITLYFVPFVPR